MSDTLVRLTKYFLLKFLQIPMSAWVKFLWANLKYRETQHLLRLDAYLLQDMGLKKVGDRIEALDSKRFDAARPGMSQASKCQCQCNRVRHAN